MGSVFAVEDNELGLVAAGLSAFYSLYPIGSILATVNEVLPWGWHICDGEGFDEERYPEIYDLLGTNKLPDLREATAVGAGENTTDAIEAHDIFELLEFKDDSYKIHGHTLTSAYRYAHADQTDNTMREEVSPEGWFGTRSLNYDNPTEAPVSGINSVGNVTMGKSFGVIYMIRME